MTEMNRKITFAQLIDQSARIEVPLIQRDYAQGRATEKDVRDDFLNALHAALTRPVGDPGLPLNLDFIYGSKKNGDAPCFLPLDGQQRLTTLFLLHWYVAWRDSRLRDFKSILWDGKHARFTYGVRPSSTEFFDELVNYVPAFTPDEILTVRKVLEDQPWFFLHWRLDPTIQSALTMLDGIHQRFRETTGLYSRLLDAQHPVITFQLLPLEHFGLSDDLYIKMNARGKPLTSFETFKARFEEHLRELFPTETRLLNGSDLTVSQFFALRMDTQWTHFFWSYRKKDSYTFDDAVMNLLWALARVTLDPADQSFADDTVRLRNKLLDHSYNVFHTHGWLNRGFADTLVCLLEAWSAVGGKWTPQLPNTRYFDEAVFFRRAVEEPAALDYSELVQFAAFVSYLRHHDGSVQPNAFQEWMRVVFNLTANTDIERPEEYGRCLSGLQKLVPYSNQILQRLATMAIESLGFSPQQVREEAFKAKLILSHAGWRAHLDGAEAHGYFTGQIEFLLDFGGVCAKADKLPVTDWGDDVHAALQSSFDRYLKMAQLTFNREGLALEGSLGGSHLWKRALLTVGDYLMHIGSNSSFLTNPPKNADSWKRFLRRSGGSHPHHQEHLKALWDRLNPSAPVEPQLTQIIDVASALEPWRALIVKYPEMIDYCGEQEIRKQDDSAEIYLLKRRQMNGAHAELFSYALHQELAINASGAKLNPLKLQPYQFVSLSEIEPHVLLSFDRAGSSVSISIESANGQYLLRSNRGGLKSLPEVDAALKELGFAEDNEVLARFSTREEIRSVLTEMARSLASLPVLTDMTS